jgi:hypothetical protein
LVLQLNGGQIVQISLQNTKHIGFTTLENIKWKLRCSCGQFVAICIIFFASCNGWRPIGWQVDVFQQQGKWLWCKMWFENMKVKLIIIDIIIVKGHR